MYIKKYNYDTKKSLKGISAILQNSFPNSLGNYQIKQKTDIISCQPNIF